MLVDADGKASRVKNGRDDNGKKVRISKKTQEVI